MDNKQDNVYSDKWGFEFAQMFKDLKQHEKIGAVIGRVVNTGPLTISILNGDVIINSSIHDIYVSNHILKDYKREFTSSGNIQFTDTDCGTTNVTGPGPHDHIVTSVTIDTDYGQSGEIILTDGLKVGDMVMVVADEYDNTFFVVSVLVKV